MWSSVACLPFLLLPGTAGWQARNKDIALFLCSHVMLRVAVLAVRLAFEVALLMFVVLDASDIVNS